MEKHEFRTKQPLWMWIPIVFIVIFAVVYTSTTKKYELGIMWLIYAAIAFLVSSFTYTITPDSFIYKRGIGKAKKFPLRNITEIERIMSRDGKVKSIIVRYFDGEIYHNFFEIKGDYVDIKAILEAIQDYYPAVSIR